LFLFNWRTGVSPPKATIFSVPPLFLSPLRLSLCLTSTHDFRDVLRIFFFDFGKWKGLWFFFAILWIWNFFVMDSSLDLLHRDLLLLYPVFFLFGWRTTSTHGSAFRGALSFTGVDQASQPLSSPRTVHSSPFFFLKKTRFFSELCDSVVPLMFCLPNAFFV